MQAVLKQTAWETEQTYEYDESFGFVAEICFEWVSLLCSDTILNQILRPLLKTLKLNTLCRFQLVDFNYLFSTGIPPGGHSEQVKPPTWSATWAIPPVVFASKPMPRADSPASACICKLCSNSGKSLDSHRIQPNFGCGSFEAAAFSYGYWHWCQQN